MTKYDETSIKILDEQEVYERIPYERYKQLADEYDKDLKWLTRAMESCVAAGVPEQYVIDRYLKKLDIPMNEAVDYQHRIRKD